MRDTIEMAREAGAIHIHEKPKEFAIVGNDSLKAFEALVRADERKAAQAEHEADKTIIEYHEATIKRLGAAVLAEREAIEDLLKEYDMDTSSFAKDFRAMGNT